MAGGERIQKINEVLKRELGALILKEIDLPSAVLITIIKVETSKDLEQCKVFTSVFPEKLTIQILKLLNAQSYYFHQILNAKLFVRKIPKIRFVEEKELQKAQRVDMILNKIKDE